MMFAVIVVFGFGYLKGINHERTIWQEAKMRQLENNLVINSEVSHELQANNNATRSRYDTIRLHAKGRVYISNTAAGCNETSRNTGVLGDVGANVTRMMRDAELQTAQLKACQEWIKRLGD